MYIRNDLYILRQPIQLFHLFRNVQTAESERCRGVERVLVQ